MASDGVDQVSCSNAPHFDEEIIASSKQSAVGLVEYN